MSTDDALRDRVRRLLTEGRFPQTEPRRSWVGHGTGQPCAVCGNEIESTEYEVEVEFTAESGVVTYIFHMPCHAVWDVERRSP